MNKLIEREGRYFIQCPDGEVETTIEEIQRHDEMLAFYQKVSDEADRMHRNQTQPRTFYPPTEYAMFKIEYLEPLGKELLRRVGSPEYDAKDLALWYSMLDIQISDLEVAKCLPNADKGLIDFKIQGVKSCILAAKKLEHLRGLFTPAAPAATSAPDRLTFDELALLCVYTGKSITKENAKEYLEGGLESGDALYNRFTHYSSQSNRTGFADETAQVRKNMLARIQKVLPRLNDEQKKRAENDIHTITAQNQ